MPLGEPSWNGGPGGNRTPYFCVPRKCVAGIPRAHTFLCPREELDPHQFLRRKLLYPLSYGDKSKLIYFCRETYINMPCPELVEGRHNEGFPGVAAGDYIKNMNYRSNVPQKYLLFKDLWRTPQKGVDPAPMQCLCMISKIKMHPPRSNQVGCE